MFVADATDVLVAPVIVLCLYFLPTIIALAREDPSKWSVAVINTFLGWTVVGWVVALAMAARSVPRVEQPAAVPTRMCPTCQRAMGRDESVCPHCGNRSAPWIFHAGVWWSKGQTDEWNWLDDKQIWRRYEDGTPSDPAAVDKTPNLRVDPSIVRPPDAPELVAAATSTPPAGDSFSAELERLADLHARGALNDEQFEKAKARLIGS
jgi:hypothetical protein